MFHKINDVMPLPDYRLSVRFSEGCTKIYDVKPLFDKIPSFAELKAGNRFEDVHIDVGGHVLRGMTALIFRVRNYGTTAFWKCKRKCQERSVKPGAFALKFRENRRQ